MTSATFNDGAPAFGSAVAALIVAHILALGTVFYPTVLIVPMMAADHGWSVTFAMGGFSTALVVAGCVSSRVGVMIDRYGGHRVMPLGSIVGACGLVGLVCADSRATYLLAWMVLGVAMAMLFYDAAFATLGRIFGVDARRPITILAVAAAFSSTVSWPTTHVLVDALGWRMTYLVYAALLVAISAPILFFALPRSRATPEAPSNRHASAPSRISPAHHWTVVLVASAFAANAFIFSGLAAHLLAIFQRLGLDGATVIALGILLGPCQALARLGELLLAQGVHPLSIIRCAFALLCAMFAILALTGLSVPIAAAIVIVLAFTNGAVTIARGTLPLILFGPAAYSRHVGRNAGPAFIMQSAGPLVVAFVAERISDGMALMVVAGVAAAALVCLLSIRPGIEEHKRSTGAICGIPVKA